MDNAWIKLDIFTTTGGAEAVCAALTELGITGYQITDANDLTDFLNRSAGYWDYYDESILSLENAETIVTAYIAKNEEDGGKLEEIEKELARLKDMDTGGEWGRLEYAMSSVFEEDWAHSWKKYYHPVKAGEKIVICPSWESYEPAGGEVVVSLDPGMAFGTGTHESTRLCLRLMEKHMPKNADVLDLGSGSGVLSVAAVLLGARSARGIDIDETSARVAKENAAVNGVSKECEFIRASIGDIAAGSYDIVFANITADIIIENIAYIADNIGNEGVLIASGVIDEREEDVIKAVGSESFAVIERAAEGGWVAMALKRTL